MQLEHSSAQGRTAGPADDTSRRRGWRRIMVTATMATLVGAGLTSGAGIAAADPVQHLTVVAGASQTAVAGSNFAKRVAVSVSADFPAEPVTFTVVSGSAAFSGGKASATVVPATTGIATAPVLKAGNTAGVVRIRATSAGASIETLETVRPRLANLALYLTAPQSASAGLPFSLKLVVMNNGNVTAVNTTVRIYLPHAALTAIDLHGGTAKINATTTQVSYVVPAIPVFGKYTFNVTVMAMPDFSGKAFLAAVTRSNTPDQQKFNNKATKTVLIKLPA